MIECLIQDEESMVFLVVTCIVLAVFLIVGLAKVLANYHHYLRRRSAGYIRFCSRSSKIGKGFAEYGLGYPLLLALTVGAFGAALAILYHYGLGLYNVAKCLWDS